MARASLEVIATSVADAVAAAAGGADHQSAMRFIVALWRYRGGQWA